MALKLSISAAEFAALKPDVQAEYMVDGDKYRIVIDGAKDPAALDRALEHEKNARKDAEKKARELQEAADENARKARDVPAIEASWKAKVDAAEAAAKKATDDAKAKISTLLVSNVANQLASKLALNPDAAELLVPVLLKRLSVADKNGEPVTVVLDAEGKESALTIDALEKEIRDNKKFSFIVTGSKANGSGAAGSRGGGGAAKSFAEMDANERTELYTTDRARFDQLAAEHSKA